MRKYNITHLKTPKPLMFKIYISESVYYDIIGTEEKKTEAARSSLYKLLKLMTPKEKNQPQALKLLSAVETEQYRSHPETVLKNPSTLYVLNVAQAEASDIQRRYGVMCLCGEHPNISPLIDVNDIHVSNNGQRLGRGWDSVLDSVEKLPSNALLLTDRYLFASTQPNAGNGIANIYDILQELLPQQFEGGSYHVTIVFDDMSKEETYSFSDIAAQLEQLKPRLARTYPLMMEVLGITPDCPLYSKLHNRMIISNYYLVEAAHKLAAFNKDRATARQMIIPLALFTESSLNGISTPPLDAINHTLSSLRQFSRSLSYRPSHNDYLYAVNGQRMERCISMRNRLLK